jgi:hypothetical protein
MAIPPSLLSISLLFQLMGSDCPTPLACQAARQLRSVATRIEHEHEAPVVWESKGRCAAFGVGRWLRMCSC